MSDINHLEREISHSMTSETESIFTIFFADAYSSDSGAEAEKNRMTALKKHDKKPRGRREKFGEMM